MCLHIFCHFVERERESQIPLLCAGFRVMLLGKQIVQKQRYVTSEGRLEKAIYLAPGSSSCVLGHLPLELRWML